jgi:hypothetical protein
MLDRVRDAIFRAITTPRGDAVAFVRVPKDLARRLNSALGMPLATRDELAKRAKARARLAELRAAGVKAADAREEGPPVFVYFERDRRVRERIRVEEMLGAKGISYKCFDVAGDEAMIEFVTRTAGCERDDLPVVFVADRAVGPYAALVEADVSSELARLLSRRV